MQRKILLMFFLILGTSSVLYATPFRINETAAVNNVPNFFNSFDFTEKFDFNQDFSFNQRGWRETEFLHTAFLVDSFHYYAVNHFYDRNNRDDVPAPVPEPSTMLLLGTGLLGIAGLFSQKKE